MKNFMFQPAKSENPRFFVWDYIVFYILSERSRKKLSFNEIWENSQYSVILKKSMVSGLVFHFLTQFLVKIKNKTMNFDNFLNHI